MDAYVGDIIGDVDIMGDAQAAEVLEALGDAPGAANLAREMAAARRIDPRAVAVRQQALARLGFQPLGIPETAFPAVAGTTIQINVSVTRAFRPSFLIIPPSIGPFFRIDSAQINGRNQLAGAGPLPCENHPPLQPRGLLRWETINPSAPLILSVTMTDGAAARVFRGGLYGAALMR